MLRYLKADHEDKKGCKPPSDWTIKDANTTANVPTQANGYDCGVFVCMYAYYLSMGKELTFTQESLDEALARKKIGLSILVGKVVA